MPRRRLTIYEAAEILGVHHMTVRRMIAQRRLPAHRLGERLIRIWSDDIENFAEPIGDTPSLMKGSGGAA